VNVLIQEGICNNFNDKCGTHNNLDNKLKNDQNWIANKRGRTFFNRFFQLKAEPASIRFL
jgi:hypothetical protein